MCALRGRAKPGAQEGHVWKGMVLPWCTWEDYRDRWSWEGACFQQSSMQKGLRQTPKLFGNKGTGPPGAAGHTVLCATHGHQLLCHPPAPEHGLSNSTWIMHARRDGSAELLVHNVSGSGGSILLCCWRSEGSPQPAAGRSALAGEQISSRLSHISHNSSVVSKSKRKTKIKNERNGEGENFFPLKQECRC